MNNAAVRTLEIGDRLIVGGRAHVVSGFTPMSVEPARIYLLDTDGNFRSVGAETIGRCADKAA